MADGSLRIIIVDDQAIFLRGLRAQFDAESDIDVVGQYTTAKDAVRGVVELRPSVTLMDLRLPRCAGEKATYCGAEAIREIRRSCPDAVIVVVTTYRDRERVREALSAGARGYLLKEDDDTNFVQKVRLAADGVAVFSEDVAKLLPGFMTANGARPFRDLTKREYEILELAAQGLDNERIATRLDRSKKTIDNAFGYIRTKLNVERREEAVRMARDAGLGSEHGDSPIPG